MALLGTAVMNGVVLVSYLNQLRDEEGMEVEDAARSGAERRFRPVVLTSVTTIAGMTPLAIWGGSLWSPLASALIFGLAGIDAEARRTLRKSSSASG